MPEKKKKVLVITYYWLPHSGTGSYRISKFVKYLIRAGWEPIILTPARSSSPFEEKQIEEVFHNIKVYRTKILEPTFMLQKKTRSDSGFANAAFFLSKNQPLKQKFIRWVRINLFIPDAKILWKPFAVRKGKEVIKKEKPALIFSTAPPPSTQLVAKKLASWSKLKWIADFRDPWTNIYYYELLNTNPLSKKINRQLEEKVLQQADRIVTVSNGFFSAPEAQKKNIRIENGYDPDDLSPVSSVETKNDQYTIRYIGTLKTNQFFKNFLLILKELGKYEEYSKNIRFELTGFVDPDIKQFIRQESINIDIIFQKYLPHKEAVQKMATADLLILAIGSGQQSKNVISTKIFEYLLAQKPILAFGHTDGAANAILKETKAGEMFSYEEYEPVKRYLLEHYDNWKNGIDAYQGNTRLAEKYNFKNLTAKLIDTFEHSMNQ